MESYNSFVLEGIKIIFTDSERDAIDNYFVHDIFDSLINILCIESYYYATGIYKIEDANEEVELLRKAILNYKIAH